MAIFEGSHPDISDASAAAFKTALKSFATFQDILSSNSAHFSVSVVDIWSDLVIEDIRFKTDLAAVYGPARLGKRIAYCDKVQLLIIAWELRTCQHWPSKKVLGRKPVEHNGAMVCSAGCCPMCED